MQGDFKEDIQHFGQLPPQAVEVEEAVLGQLILDSSSYDRIVSLLTPESFYKEANQKVYGVIEHLKKANRTVDILTVVEELKRTNNLELVGGAYAVSQLGKRVVSATNIVAHAKIVKEKYVARGIINIGAKMQNMAYAGEQNNQSMLDDISRMYGELNNIYAGDRVIPTFGEGIDESLKNAERVQAATRKGEMIGISTGLSEYNKLIFGFQKTDLIIIAARPSMGKTALALFCLRVALKLQKKVAFFSYEMARLKLMDRVVTGEADVNASNYARGYVSDAEWTKLNRNITESFYQSEAVIDDFPGGVEELKGKARLLHKEGKLEILFLDYLQLVPLPGKRSRNEEVGAVSRALKALAKELSIPIVALSQLSRNVETRGGSMRPKLSDLRESGEIEQDADVVTFIHRPEYYNILEDDNGESTLGLVELITAKNRNGPVGTAKVGCNESLTRFYDLNSSYDEQELEIKDNTDIQPEQKSFEL